MYTQIGLRPDWEPIATRSKENSPTENKHNTFRENRGKAVTTQTKPANCQKIAPLTRLTHTGIETEKEKK